MAENTNIAWTDNTFNPWMGCLKISKACDNNPVENGKSLKGKFAYKGSDFDSFPEDLRVREFPEVKAQ